MAWEERNGRRVYYRKIWEKGRVRSIHVGGGLAGELAALQDAQAQAEHAAQRAVRSAERAEAQALDAEYRWLRDLVKATLLVEGDHTHKRQWRPRRPLKQGGLYRG